MKVDRGSSKDPRPFPPTQNHTRLMMGEPSMKQGGNHLVPPLSRISHITWHLKCAAVSISPFAGMRSLGLESGSFAAFLELRPCASPTQPEDSCAHLLGSSPTEHAICPAKDKGGVVAGSCGRQNPAKDSRVQLIYEEETLEKLLMLNWFVLKVGLSKEEG